MDKILNTPMSISARLANATPQEKKMAAYMRFAGFDVLHRLDDRGVPEAQEINSRLAAIDGQSDSLSVDLYTVMDDVMIEQEEATDPEEHQHLSRVSSLASAAAALSVAHSVFEIGKTQDREVMLAYARDEVAAAGAKLGLETQQALEAEIQGIEGRA